MNDIKDMCLNGENLVVMSNDLVKSKSDLALHELQLLRLTIMQVIKQDTDLKTYKVSITDLADLLQISRQGIHKDIHDITRHLMEEVLEIGDGNPKHKWKLFHWCDMCSYDNGILTIKLSEELKPYLLDLSQLYTQYALEDILTLKSVYSIRLYELLKEALRGKKVYADHVAEVTISVDTIRKATSTEDKYEKMGMLKDRVIDSAIKEINEKLGYYITYTDVKESRKVVAFKFNLKSEVWARMLGEIPKG